MRIHGKCHCGNIRYALDWPESTGHIPVRACSCSFCVKHGGRWTSHRDATLVVQVRDGPLIRKYRFGTKTADFYVCTACGTVPFVTSAIDHGLYAVVNVNTFEGVDSARLTENTTNFDGEGPGERLDRRKRNWIPRVRISGDDYCAC
ncbi:MAG: GFA family protein [Betaproteobacteria bacterium]